MKVTVLEVDRAAGADWTGEALGWLVTGHSTAPHWRWTARVDGEVREGHAVSYERATWAAKVAFAELALERTAEAA